MYKSIARLIITLGLMMGCHSPLVAYSYHNNLNWLTVESQGDDLTDYNEVKKRGEIICFQNGFKNGINIAYAHPTDSMSGASVAAYTIAYNCKTNSVQ